MFTDDSFYPFYLFNGNTMVDKIKKGSQGKIIRGFHDNNGDTDGNKGIEAGNASNPDQNQAGKYSKGSINISPQVPCIALKCDGLGLFCHLHKP